MSAQLQHPNSFSAHLALAAGVAVSITAETMEQLAGVVAKLQGTEPANDTGLKALEGKTVTVVADGKTAKAEAGKASPAPSPTPAPVSAQAAGSGSESGDDAPKYTYDDVKDRVLKLAKISRETATKTLGAFKTVGGDKVDHGNKLQLPDYPAFIAAADKAITAAGAPA